MKECNLCSPYLSLKANYNPTEFIIGKINSPVWIVGLNPKKKDAKWYQYDLERTPHNLSVYFSEPGIHSYFKGFKKVSPQLFSLLGKDKGVACTDIIKCFSEKYPPANCEGKKLAWIIRNCQIYLEEQLRIFEPKLIICNGSDVCRTMKKIILPINDEETSYLGMFGNNMIRVILSGFIGRIDDSAKRRLGIEIECYMKELSIGS